MVQKKKSVAFQGLVFSVTREMVREPGGVRALREIVRHPGSAVVIARDPQGRFLLVRQYRYAARQKLWEAVAGRIDAGETPLQAARRELTEEAGFSAQRWTKLGMFYPSPGFMDERMWLFLAEDLRPASAPCDPDERISKKWFSREDLTRLVRQRKIVDAKTIIAYFLTS